MVVPSYEKIPDGYLELFSDILCTIICLKFIKDRHRMSILIQITNGLGMGYPKY